MASATDPRDEGPRAPVVGIGALIDRWQADHDLEAFTTLVTEIRGPLEGIVGRLLRRRGIRDPAARDDAVALILERLFRLGCPGAGRVIVRFDVDRRVRGAADPGWAYLRCVAWSRVRDVTRERGRRERREADGGSIRRWCEPPASGADTSIPDTDRLRTAVAMLDEPARTVATLLLEGKTQAVAAHVLGVCEGTVSRIRSRAIADLRRLLAE